jgi:hypothetical protein
MNQSDYLVPIVLFGTIAALVSYAAFVLIGRNQ